MHPAHTCRYAAGDDDFTQLCEDLGARLETERDGKYKLHASLCYICGGSIEAAVSAWTAVAQRRDEDSSATAADVFDTMAKVTVLLKAMALRREEDTIDADTVLTSVGEEYVVVTVVFCLFCFPCVCTLWCFVCFVSLSVCVLPVSLPLYPQSTHGYSFHEAFLPCVCMQSGCSTLHCTPCTPYLIATVMRWSIVVV